MWCCAGRWKPTQLYRALDEICEPRDATDEPTRTIAAAIDPVAFSGLEKSVGVKTLVEILQCYIVTAEQLTNALAAGLRRGEMGRSRAAGPGYCRRGRRAGPGRHHPGGAAISPRRRAKAKTAMNCATPPRWWWANICARDRR